MALADQQCIPCRGGVPPFDGLTESDFFLAAKADRANRA
jgi:hypothetical protein